MDWKEIRKELEQVAQQVDEKGWDSLEGKMALNLLLSTVVDLVRAMEELGCTLEGFDLDIKALRRRTRR